MALVTGGMSGMGLVASYEHATAGRERIVAVSRSAHMIPGEHEAHLLDVIQDIATHYIIRCDIADAGAWSDAIAFANNIGEHDDFDPKATMKDAQMQLRGMDSLDIINVLISSLNGMVEAGAPINASKLNRVIFFRNNMSRGLAETMEKARIQPYDRDMQARLFQFQELLQELSGLIDLFRKRGLVEEHPGTADAGPLGGLFPAEAAGVDGAAQDLEARVRYESQAVASGNTVEGCQAVPAKDVLLEMMEVELLLQRNKHVAGRSSACGVFGDVDIASNIASGQINLQRETSRARPDLQQEQSQATEGVGSVARKPPEPPHLCEGCGRECAMSRMHCSECQRVAERGALEDAIRRAKEEMQRKAERDAVRKLQREESERRAKEKATQKEEEEAQEERQAKEEAGRKEREQAECKAKAEAERKAQEETDRRVQKDAQRREAERQVRGEADLGSLDETVCPSGHDLQRFITQAGFPCDMCNVESVEGAIMWGCRHKNARDLRTCDYDVCEQCKSSRLRQTS
mmetsp:Transcript_3749/g.10346  ORF Transcript_3749/g.10346 Transcript_3749/m.10346 type:complete len:519 (-) Transcript_3749:84-1640(-)